VDVPGGIGIKAIEFNDETKQGKALLKLHRAIRKI
jgi:hypothetical protein